MSELRQRVSLRWHMSFIIMTAAVLATLLSKLLLLVGLLSMPLRYGVVAVSAYGVFFLLIKLWIRFVAEQSLGPYKEWIHTHTFEATSSGTVIRDGVRYRLPLRPLGELAFPLVKLQLDRIFRFREKAIRSALLKKSP